jgi:tetratricopeptide (TPR) repeat protein
VALVLSRKRLGRGPLVAALYFGGTLFPALGFVDVWPMRYSFVADHFVYISSIGLIALIAAVVARYLTFEVVTGVATVVLLLLFGVTFNQARIYEDKEALWKDILAKTNENSWFAANNYGVWVLDESKLTDPFERYNVAEKWFHKVIRLNPDHAEARFNLARLAEKRARLAEQELEWRAANPTSRPAAMRSTTQPADFYAQAVRHLREAIDLQPNYVDAHYFLAQLLLSMGRTDDAVKHFKLALEYYPRHELAHVALGMIDVKANKLADAREHFIRAIEINPDSVKAHIELGTLLLLEGHLAEGLAEWEEAMRLAPNDPDLPNAFGAKMASSGEYLKASDYFKRALAIDPTSVDAMTNIGVTAALAGFPKEARDWFNRALQTDPNFTKAKENLEALNAGHLTTRPAATQPATRPVPTTQ